MTVSETAGRPLPLWFLVLSAGLLAATPAAVLVRNYSADHAFLGLLHFGQKFAPRRLAEVDALHPPTASPEGYDGQFYAQLALDPSLQRRDLRQALDNPVYRARRIGLPLLAFIAGMGRPQTALNAYALLNPAFWMLLATILWHALDTARLRSLLCASAVLGSSGVLISVSRALPDLPAAALSLWAAFLPPNRMPAALCLSLAVLSKETALLSIFCILTPQSGGNSRRYRVFAVLAVAVLPLAAWMFYVLHQLGGERMLGAGNFALPLTGIAHKLSETATALRRVAASGRWWPNLNTIFEALCTFSLAAQALYFGVKPRLSSRLWRYGIGFAILLLLLGPSIWVEQAAYSRSLLPLTIAFNLLIHRYETRAGFAGWYLLGNVGMAHRALIIWMEVINHVSAGV